MRSQKIFTIRAPFSSLYSHLLNPPGLSTLSLSLKNELLQSVQVKVKVTLRLTVSQSVLVSSAIWGSSPDIYYCLIVTVLLLWGALSYERTGLSFIRVSNPYWVWVWVMLRPTVSRSVCLGIKHPSGAYDQIFLPFGIRLTVTFLIPWVALSDERTGLSYVCAAGPCQRRLSRVLVPWDLRPYFTVSVLRLPFLSPPTTRRVTVEVFDPTSTRVKLSNPFFL
jgi:hypothetical protein